MDENKKKSYYEINKVGIKKYIQNKYNTDEEYRNNKKQLINDINKNRYANDEEYKQKVKSNMQKYRAQKKQQELQEFNNIIAV